MYIAFEIIITRDSEAIMFPPGVIVGVCVRLCVCVSQNYMDDSIIKELVPHQRYFAGT